MDETYPIPAYLKEVWWEGPGRVQVTVAATEIP